jgi:hypothetical protein
MPLFRALAKNMAASYFGKNYLRFSHRSEISVCTYSVPLMKTLDWSVETLGLGYNSTGLCNHLFKPE